MHQTCLCQFLGIVCDHPDTFLRIPASIRERIYLHAGLMTGQRINFGQWPDSDDAEDTAVLYSICPQVAQEVEALLFQHNTWVLAEDSIDETLDSLWTMKPESCARLRDVYVHMRQKKSYYARNPEVLRWSRIRKWQGAAMHLLEHATPGQLRLHFICDVGDNMDMARAVVAPFESFPKRLRELELHLSSIPSQDMRDLARGVVIQTQVFDDDQPRLDYFPFLNLPLEIRHQIFSYTGLVLPYRNVLWEPVRGFRLQYIFCECDGTVCRERDLHYNHRFGRCDADQYEGGTFCSRWNSCYSPRCRHEVALSLLLANRALYEEAMAFFLASNRITIASNRSPDHAISAWDPVHGGPPSEEDWGNIITWGDHDQLEETYSSRQITRNPVRLFIDRVGTSALCNLREIEIVLPRHTTKSSFQDTAQVYTDWCQAVDLLAEHATLGGLTIMLHIFTRRGYLQWPLAMTKDIRQTQSLRVIAPLQKLSQVKKLFVFLEWPYHWAPARLRREIDESGLPKKPSPGCGIGEHVIPRPEPLLVAEEVQLEKQVMGDAYDSFAVGKGDLLPSPWLRSCWDNPQT